MSTDSAGITTSGLSAVKQQLLKRLLSRTAGGAGSRTIVREPGRQEYPLSFAQQRLWFLQQLEPASFFYTIIRAFHFTGPLQAELLKTSLREVLRRHDSLRTTFRPGGTGPAQAVTGEVRLASISAPRSTRS